MKLHALVLALSLTVVAGEGGAHGTEEHAAPPTRPALSGKVSPLPWDVGGAFALTDHTGARRTQADPAGNMQLLFFGYANCPGICSAALPMMADAADALAARGIATSPVVVTIDPGLDTLETMGPALAKISDDLIGLTGDRQSLNVAYEAFRIEFQKIMDDPEYGPIYAHGSHIYVLDGVGKVLTLVPPVLSAGQVADIVERYVEG